MNSITKTLHDEKLDALLSSYAQDGFDVIKEPSASQIPFDLGDYKPDLIAIKGGTHLIIEIKTTTSRFSVDRFQSLAQEISKHPGWRFLLVTLEDVDSKKIPTAANELPTWSHLEEKLRQAQTLINGGALEPALLYLWSIFEAALRKQAIAQSIPVERLPTSIMLNHMYSQGEVSVEQIDLFREIMNKRNRVAHGASEVIDVDLVNKFAQATKNLLIEWSDSKSIQLTY